MISCEFTSTELRMFRRALQIYARHYHDLRMREQDPFHRADLKKYIEAADRLNIKVFDIIKGVKAT